MLFNSLEFALFLPIVFILYWFVFKKLKYQNILIVIVSYFFYGWWDYRFLLLIFFSTTVDFLVANIIERTTKEQIRKKVLLISVLVNLGFLGFFKYYNFFLNSFSEAFTFFGETIELERLKIILPVGISFYTFQTLSYTIDVYNKKIKATKDFISFAAFVSFFPQLVAGPIERATHLLPQFYNKRFFSYNKAKSGVKLIIWGFFKKIVIADNAAIIVDGIFDNYQGQSSLSLSVGAFLFAFQIYGDFSGYSDIAIGTARLFGFDLMTNFKFPYLSKNIAEFWKRWHISLSTWFRDYLYFPLGGSKGSLKKSIRNVFIIFLVSGFWHGANWTFIVWGLIHAILYIPLFIKNKKGIIKLKQDSSFKIYLNTLITFIITTLAWVFFRADSIGDAIGYLKRVLLLNNGANFFISTSKYKLITLITFLSILYLMILEKKYLNLSKNEILLNKKALILLIMLTAFIGAFKNHASFIYFQF